MRQQLNDQLAYERAQAQAADLAEKLEKQMSKPADLDKVAKAEGLTVQESGFFARDEPILGLGPAPEAANKAFDMKPGDVAGPLRASRGFVFETLVAKQDPYVPKLDEVKERVRDEVIKQKARDLSTQKAAEMAAKLKAAPDFEKAAKAAGFEAKTTELIARDAPIPDLGASPAVDDAAFKLPVGAVSTAIATDNGTAVVKVLDKKEVTADEWSTAKDRFREEQLAERRNRFFSAYMAKAKQKMKIDVNREIAATCCRLAVDGRRGHKGEQRTQRTPLCVLVSERSSHRQRKNVKGISARISPGLNIDNGPRIARSASISPRVSWRASRRQGGRLQRVARPAELFRQQLVEALSRRVDDDFHVAVGGDLRALLRDRDGAVQAAELVDQLVLFRLPAGPHPALRQRVDFLRRAVPRVRHLFHELVVERLELLLQFLSSSGL